MWSFILSELGPWLLGAGGILVGIVVAYFKGQGDGKKLERTKITEGQLKLRKQYDEVDSQDIDPGGSYDRLRGLQSDRKR